MFVLSIRGFIQKHECFGPHWVFKSKKLSNMHYIYVVANISLKKNFAWAQPDELQLARCTSATGCQHSFRWTLKHLQRKSNQSISSTHLLLHFLSEAENLSNWYHDDEITGEPAWDTLQLMCPFRILRIQIKLNTALLSYCPCRENLSLSIIFCAFW